MEKTGIGLLSNTQKLLKRSIFVISLCGALSGGASNLYASESVFEHDYSLTLTYNNASLEQVLDAISKQAGIKIAYSNDVIVEKQVTVNIKTTDIREALRVVLGDGYTFKQIDDYIAIAKVTKAESTITNKVADDREWTIQGQVMENVEPPMSLPGVNVVIKGTTLGTITDGNGYFSIKAKKGDVLVFKYIGFKDYEYVVSRQISNLSVAMTADSEELDEVIVTGMSEEKRLNSVSAVSTLNVAANLTTKPITSISQSLQGGITGLNVSQSTGLPGADNAVIKIRGISSIKTNNDPLVLVDGIPMDMNNLDPNTIESMTVLKDAAAAAMYGSRAVNGVIVVKTKRGMPGKVNVNYNGYVGVQQATYLPKFVDGATYMEMANAAQMNIGGDPIYSQDAINATRNHTDPIKYPDTDWADYMFKNGFIQNHSIGVSGGGNLARFALNVNWLKNQGLIEKAKSDRLNIRANTSVNLLDNLSVNMDFNAYRSNRYEPMYRKDEHASKILEFIYRTPSNVMAVYPKKEGRDIIFYGNRPEQRNPAAMIEQGGEFKALEDNVSINIAPRWEIIPKLIVRGQYSYRVSSVAKTQKRRAYNFFDYETDVFLQTWGAINEAAKDRSSYYYLGGTAEYTFEKDKHRLFVLGGYNQEQTNSGDWDQYSMVSLFAKANYTFNDRYLLEGTVRRDGSSRFGKGHKYGVFPSIGAGWNVTEENFMKNLSFVNHMKVRGSYGMLGNENVGLYKYQNLIDAGNGNETVFGNPNLTWETVRMLDVGFDMTLFKDLDITFDYYNKLTTDLILAPPISFIGGTFLGNDKRVLLNSGKLRNRGWELDLNYGKQLTKNFSFNIHGGLSHNENEIEDLFGGPYDNNTNVDMEGYALNSYYVYPTDGLLQESDFTKDASDKWIPKEGVVIFDGQQPGDIHYIDNNKDGLITADDRVVRGDDQPTLNYFANISLNWKKWSFETLFQGVSGSESYYTAPFSYGMDIQGDGLTPITAQTDYWTPTNTGARYPRLAPNASYGNNHHQSDFWRFNSSYCRIKYIQLGYTFDQMALKKMGIQSIRVYVNAQNPFTFAEDDLIDPEGKGQMSSYPMVKTYSFGLNLNF